MAAQDPTVSTESNGSALVGTAVVFLVLSWFSVLLRTYVRVIMLKSYRADDWFMLVAQVNFTISCSFILVGVYNGMGRHDKSLDVYHEIESLKYQALATATYITNMMFIKFSIGLFLLRLATQKVYKYIIYGSIVVVGIWSIVLFFWNLFQCHPLTAQWDYTILDNDPTASCVSAQEIVNAAYALSAMSVISDWFYALIPVPMVWNVKMTKQAKITVILVLGLGIFASVATLIRVKFLADLTQLDDLLFATTDAMVWTLIEPGVAIMASSLATIRPLLRSWKIRGFQSTGQSGSKRTGPSYGYGGSRSHGGAVRSGSRSAGGMPGFGSAPASRSRDSKNIAMVTTTTTIDIEACAGGNGSSNGGSSSSLPGGVTTTTATASTHSVTFDRAGTTPVPLGGGGRRPTLSRITERTIETRDSTMLAAPKPPGLRQEVHSEIYIIEGGRKSTRSGSSEGGSPTRTSQDPWPFIESATSSEVELTRLEPLHTTSDAGLGLGSPGRK